MDKKPIELVAGASTQSRARRPLPDGWNAVALSRDWCRETWDVATRDGRHFHHLIRCTWVFDQGGPVFGYREPHLVFTYGPMGIASYLERDAADLLGEIVGPFHRGGTLGVRWVANGSDACDMAVRLARFNTGRTRFISTGYHGSSVIFAHPPQCGGVPDVIMKMRTDVEFGDGAGLKKAFAGRDKPACFIVEVPSTDEKAREFLTLGRALCDTTGALFILDEVVTGFRLALGGAAEHYAVPPDLACYGKALANGRPVAAVVGDSVIMQALAFQVFYSNTYNGDPHGMLLALLTLRELQGDAESIYPHLWAIGAELKSGLNGIGVPVVGHAPRSAIAIPDEAKRREFCARMIEKGILVDRPNYASMAHSIKHTRWTIHAAEEVLSEMEWNLSES